MKYDELNKLDVKALKARLKEINTQGTEAKGQELEDLTTEASDIVGIIEDREKRAKLAKLAADHNEDPAPQDGEGESAGEAKDKVKSTRGQAAKAGKVVRFKAKETLAVRNALSVTQTAPATRTATDVLPTFNNVSSLVDAVRVIPLNGGETYTRGYVKSYGDGAGETAENAAYSTSEPVFGYATITKEKVTAYCEEPEEMTKLPDADYDTVVQDAVTRSLRRFMNRQIMTGDGASGHFSGIFNKPTNASDDIIDRSTDIALTAIDDGTLDEVVYSFGGDEDVEDMAVLILNKRDLKAFAKVRDKQGRKVYTIVNQGNTGTIDGIPYIINSACGAVSDAQTAADVYCMAYGPLSNYELAIFSDIDAKKSTDYKFATGQIAYRADVYAGGSVVAYNGFERVYRPKTA
jgi:HK97 family phage major capsid protein